jgi:pyridoxamine 5'-phosphate oxidase
MTLPIELLNAWLSEELASGAPDPRQAVISTATSDGTPHARVVAIREINEDGLLFFTQRGTRKVEELDQNPKATLTFWFELHQREVIIEGIAEPLTDSENNNYWKSYPREAQIRFYSYAPTSTQPIDSKTVLETKKKQIELEYEGKPLPVSPFYCGFRIKPTRMSFYAYRADELSDVFEYQNVSGNWIKQWLSP